MFFDRQAEITRRLSVLQTQETNLTPLDYVTEAAAIAADWAAIGARRSAEMLLSASLEKHYNSLPQVNRVQLGLELCELLIDSEARNARVLIQKLEQDIASPLVPISDRAHLWLIKARCCLHLCEYANAVASFQQVRQISVDPEQRATAAAEIAETHFLQGEVNQALTVN